MCLQSLHPKLGNKWTDFGQAKNEHGSVLFFILICIALFAALAYAITGSTRSGGGDASKEQATLDSAEISQYSTTIENAIMRLKISGCSDEQISFENPHVTGYINPNAPTNKSCHVFDPAGGGVSFRKDWAKVLDSTYSTNSLYGAPFFSGGSDVSVTTKYNYPDPSTKDLVLYFPFLKKSVCDALNMKLAGFTSSDIVPYEQYTYVGGTTTKWKGDYAETVGGILGQWAEGKSLDGSRSGCFRSTATAGTPSYSAPDLWSGEYTFFHILVPR